MKSLIPSKDCLLYLNHKENLTYLQISKLYDVSKPTIYNWFNKCNIKGQNNQVNTTKKHSKKVLAQIAEKNRKHFVTDYNNKSELINPEDFVNSLSKLNFSCYMCDNIFSRTWLTAKKSKLNNMCPDCFKKYQTTLYKSPEYEGRFTSPDRTIYNRSKQEIEIFDFITDIYTGEVIHSHNVNGINIDIYLPDFNIGIEFNGLFWHSEARYYIMNQKSVKFMKNYHKHKTDKAKESGIQLIHIWEDDWNIKPELIKNWLKGIINLSTPRRIFGRKTKVSEINTEQAKMLLNENHIQGYVNSSIKIGLFYQNELISVMTFIKGQEYNLSRYVVQTGYQVIGGFSKMLKYFVNTYGEKIISFADLSWVNKDSNVYLRNGFSVVNELTPDYKYLFDNKRVHKFNFRHKQLSKILPDYNDSLTEYQNCLNHNIYRIWDSGKIKYTLTQT